MAQLKLHSERESGTLFPLASQFRIARLGSLDARKLSDNLRILKGLIAGSEEMYPNIGRWFDEKVVPGLRSSERVAWVGYEGEKPVAAAVLKRGEKSKFCHVKIDQGFQDMDLGRLFFTMMTLEVRHLASEIHFTLPESLWLSKTKFFASFGFSRATRSSRQYRHGEAELLCSAPLRATQALALDGLPILIAKFNIGGHSLASDLLVSMRPKYAQKILTGSKVVEIRKKFSAKWVGRRAVLYASNPEKALVGEATIRSVSHGSPSQIWNQFGSSIGCSFEEFSLYVGNATKINAIELDEVYPYKEPIPLTQISHLLQKELRPPQSYRDLRLTDRGSNWSTAISLASLLHGTFSSTKTNSAPGEWIS